MFKSYLKKILLCALVGTQIVPAQALSEKQHALLKAGAATIFAAGLTIATTAAGLHAFLPNLVDAKVVLQEPEIVCSGLKPSYEMFRYMRDPNVLYIKEMSNNTCQICYETGNMVDIKYPLLNHALNHFLTPLILGSLSYIVAEYAIEQWQLATQDTKPVTNNKKS